MLRRRAHRLRQQALAQVVLDRARRDARALGELAHLQAGLCSRQELPATSRGRPPRPRLSAAISSRAEPGLGQHLLGVLAERRPAGACRVGRRARELDRRRRAAAPGRRPGWSTSTTISRARTSSESSASSSSEHRLQAAVVLGGERLPLARACARRRPPRPRGGRPSRGVELALDEVLAPDAASTTRPRTSARARRASPSRRRSGRAGSRPARRPARARRGAAASPPAK